jgi:hypothetical protein
MMTGIRGDGGQLGTGTPGNSGGRRVVGHIGRSELDDLHSPTRAVATVARRPKSIGSLGRDGRHHAAYSAFAWSDAHTAA